MTARHGRRHSDRATRPGRLRIVAGKWRSRLLPIADVPELRPTSERIRETLFNWLAPSIAGARCLDLFAGTGALGLEALSRGASSVVFVERSEKAVGMLRSSIRALGAEGADVVRADARQYLAGSDLPSFDVVFLDPPFKDNRLGELCRLLKKSGCLARNARVYLEQDRDAADTDLPDGWTTTHDRTAGKVRYRLVSVDA